LQAIPHTYRLEVVGTGKGNLNACFKIPPKRLSDNSDFEKIELRLRKKFNGKQIKPPPPCRRSRACRGDGGGYRWG